MFSFWVWIKNHNNNIIYILFYWVGASLLEKDDTGDIVLESFCSKKQLSIFSSVFLRVFNVDALKTLCNGSYLIKKSLGIWIYFFSSQEWISWKLRYYTHLSIIINNINHLLTHRQPRFPCPVLWFFKQFQPILVYSPSFPYLILVLYFIRVWVSL